MEASYCSASRSGCSAPTHTIVIPLVWLLLLFGLELLRAPWRALLHHLRRKQAVSVTGAKMHVSNSSLGSGDGCTQQVRRLDEIPLAQLDAAILIAAAQVGLDIKKHS